MAKTSLDKQKIRILLLEGIHPTALETLNRAGYHNVEEVSGSLSEDQLCEKIQGIHILGIRSRTQITSRVVDAADKLMAIGCFCIGTNQVDLVATLGVGIPVFNAPFSNTRSVAELVIAEAILLLRGIPQKSALMHRGVWQKSAKNSFEIRNKTLGIVGYGNIGTQVSVLAESLGMHVVFHDVTAKLPIGRAHAMASLDELLAAADVVSFHVPETPATRMLMTPERIAGMKPGSVLINASRGTVIDLDALAAALDSGHLLGAAVDVFPKEPKSNDEEFISPLRNHDNQVANVLLTPHVGGSTVEAQENIGVEVAEKLVTYSDNGSTVASVNFPSVGLPEHPGSHRLLHIHQNIPGVLTEINRIFSDKSINILAQYLQTNEKVGYVVIDVEQQHSSIALAELQQVAGTIRTRLLF
ncbi:MAG: phosphoglycerate dehydrogenase [Proteobacteria bacterium]|jgi:D-3-phosphoglycerate dehydrogenase / 2-oxoglutarate reductase|nr:phosphoglycerate dehydrogenase [Pseudomonadota bacterium]